MKHNPGLSKLFDEAEQAMDSRTNGLMDRDEFPILIGKLLAATRDLLAEKQQLEQECNEYARRLSNPPRSTPPGKAMLDSLLAHSNGSVRN